MKIYATFTPEGDPTGFYPTDIFDRAPYALDDDGNSIPTGERDPRIPAEAVEITEAQWREMIDHAGLRRWNGSEPVPFAPPPAPAIVPELVTMRQAKLTLEHSGLLEAADAIIAAMPGLDGRLARIEWTSSASIRRDHPLVTALGTELDLPDAQVDALFIWAAAL